MYLRFISKMTSLVCGGTKFVLLASQINRAFRCCLPTLGQDKRLTVSPVSALQRQDSSITVFSRYHVSFGGGLPPRTSQIRFTSLPSLYGSSNLEMSLVVPSSIIGFDGGTARQTHTCKRTIHPCIFVCTHTRARAHVIESAEMRIDYLSAA